MVKDRIVLPKPEEFKKFFTTNADLTCLQSEFLMKGSLGKADLFLTNKDGVYNIFLRRKKEIICLKNGLKMFKDAKKYASFMKEFKECVNNANNVLIPKFSKVPESLSREEFDTNLKKIGKFWYYYGYTEFPYMDLAVEVANKTNDLKIKARLDEFSKYKFKAREVLNAYFFKDGVLNNILAYVSKRFSVNARVFFTEEINDLYDGKRMPETVMNDRLKCYSAAIIDGKIIMYPYDIALKLNAAFVAFDDNGIIKGVRASPGVAWGKVVVSPMLNDHNEIAKINKIMKKGDILVAETTSPDTMMLCSKAAAIVAEQSGLLSHAAVVSREMKIPCILQATNATRIFKNGDYVKVDADKGVVQRISEQVYKKLNKN